MKKCCVTGSRPQTLRFFMKYGDLTNIAYTNYCDAIFVTIDQAITNGFDYFISGGALGVDLDFAEAVIQYKNLLKFRKKFKNKKIFLEIAVPCKDQCLKWNDKDKQRYKNILSQADYVTLVNKTYSPNCMQKRNEYMVDSSEKVFAFWHGENFGGTWNTIKYAMEENRQIEIIKLNEIKKN